MFKEKFSHFSGKLVGHDNAPFNCWMSFAFFKSAAILNLKSSSNFLFSLLSLLHKASSRLSAYERQADNPRFDPLFLKHSVPSTSLSFDILILKAARK